MSAAENKGQAQPPPAQGVRIDWQAVPARVKAAVEQRLGSAITSVVSQPSGFSPGVAVRLGTADHQKVFIKAIGPEINPDSVRFHRREAQIAALLPPAAPVPPLLWTHDEGDEGWVVLAFEEIAGLHPAQPWRLDELHRVLDALAVMGEVLTPSPLPPGIARIASEEIDRHISGWRRLKNDPPHILAQIDDWSARHLDALAEIEVSAKVAVAGNTLLHFDVRADNILLTAGRVWFVDWPHSAVGAAWLDILFFAPSVYMQGGSPPEDIIAHHPSWRNVNPDAITVAVAAISGFFTRQSLQPPPPGIPTVRAFQAAQGVVAREWLAQRTGWT